MKVVESNIVYSMLRVPLGERLIWTSIVRDSPSHEINSKIMKGREIDER